MSNIAQKQEIPDFCEEFLNYKKVIRGKADNTINSYANDFKLIFNFIKQLKGIDMIDVDVLKTITVDDYYEFLLQFDNISTRNRRICSLKSLGKWLKKRRESVVINGLLDLETSAIGNPFPNYLTKNEMDLIVKATSKSNYPERDRAIITVLANTGMRVSELIDLNLNSIKDNKVTITGKGNKQRVVPLNEKSINIIQEYLNYRLESNTNALFTNRQGNKMSIITIWNLVKNAMERAGIDTTKYHTHSFRHTFATNFLLQGADIIEVQEMLGHEDIKTTRRYAKMTVQQLEKRVSSFSI